MMHKSSLFDHASASPNKATPLSKLIQLSEEVEQSNAVTSASKLMKLFRASEGLFGMYIATAGENEGRKLGFAPDGFEWPIRVTRVVEERGEEAAAGGR